MGLDRGAAKEAFARFLDGSRYSSQQIRFVEMIIERLTVHGEVSVGQLYEAPFTSVHHKGLDGAFSPQEADALQQALDATQLRVA